MNPPRGNMNGEKKRRKINYLNDSHVEAKLWWESFEKAKEREKEENEIFGIYSSNDKMLKLIMMMIWSKITQNKKIHCQFYIQHGLTNKTWFRSEWNHRLGIVATQLFSLFDLPLSGVGEFLFSLLFHPWHSVPISSPKDAQKSARNYTFFGIPNTIVELDDFRQLKITTKTTNEKKALLPSCLDVHIVSFFHVVLSSLSITCESWMYTNMFELENSYSHNVFMGLQ